MPKCWGVRKTMGPEVWTEDPVFIKTHYWPVILRNTNLVLWRWLDKGISPGKTQLFPFKTMIPDGYPAGIKVKKSKSWAFQFLNCLLALMHPWLWQIMLPPFTWPQNAEVFYIHNNLEGISQCIGSAFYQV